MHRGKLDINIYASWEEEKGGKEKKKKSRSSSGRKKKREREGRKAAFSIVRNVNFYCKTCLLTFREKGEKKGKTHDKRGKKGGKISIQLQHKYMNRITKCLMRCLLGHGKGEGRRGKREEEVVFGEKGERLGGQGNFSPMMFVPHLLDASDKKEQMKRKGEEGVSKKKGVLGGGGERNRKD